MNRDNSKGSLGRDMREPSITSRHYINLFNLSKLLQEIIGGRLAQEENMSILDLGCGEKPYQPFFNGKYSSYVGIDITSYSWADVLASSENLPFKNSSFDLCLCTQVYEHIPSPRQTTREVCRILKEKGVLLLSTHAAFPVHDYPTDYWRWTDQGLKMMLKKYFLDIDVYNIMTPVETIIQLAVFYLPIGKLGSLCTMFSNEFARFLGNYWNKDLPRLIGSYLVVARK